MTELCDLSAVTLLALIRSGDCTASDIIQSCFNRIEASEPAIKGFVQFNRAAAIEQAQRLDADKPRGPLHGIPIAIKDTIDVADFVCSWGTSIHAHRIPSQDAFLVRRLREAGAIIVGTTVSTEYAIARAGPTRNPHDLTRTPGGSSSGSGAVVAAHMVPLAVGTQTLGSIVRPSTYCGIYGYKPTIGAISTDGVMTISAVFDTVGPMARCLDDIELFNAAFSLAKRDPSDGPTRHRPSTNIPILQIDGPFADRIEPETRQALQQAVAILRVAGNHVSSHDLPARFDAFTECFETIVFRDVANAHGRDFDEHSEMMSDRFREIVTRGRMVTDADYKAAMADRQFYLEYLDGILGENGVILAPATDGVAPTYSEQTGNQRIQSLYSVIGYPALAVPCQPIGGLPVGVQFASKRNHDALVLAIARVLETGLRGKPEFKSAERLKSVEI
jgi:Asp-tRNA(Asn)/Glu-tRNA(Gln) amidotransferase A subunit family amidase